MNDVLEKKTYTKQTTKNKTTIDTSNEPTGWCLRRMTDKDIPAHAVDSSSPETLYLYVHVHVHVIGQPNNYLLNEETCSAITIKTTLVPQNESSWSLWVQ